MADPLLPNPLYIAGPTATGKSAVAMELARRHGGEIIAVDSMQVYQGLDIGTAKPSEEERRAVPHHLLDIVRLTSGGGFDASQFVQSAKATTREVQVRGRLPILCGGTGLYFKALFDGLGSAPPSDAVLRSSLEKLSTEELACELQQADPSACHHVDRNNRRRLIRALEVVRLTGRSFSELRSEWKGSKHRKEKGLAILDRTTGDLERRIDRRVENMFARGLVDEVRSLLDAGLEKNATAMQAIGYRQVVEHLRQKRSLVETVEAVKIRTRQFAKRQRTWFRNQLSGHWILAESDETVESLADRMESILQEPECSEQA